jgi:hypothetical protein
VAAAVEAAREEVRGAAQANLRLEGALAEARTQVAVVRSSELDHHKEGCAALLARQQAVVAALGPQRVVAALENALSGVRPASSVSCLGWGVAYSSSSCSVRGVRCVRVRLLRGSGLPYGEL